MPNPRVYPTSHPKNEIFSPSNAEIREWEMWQVPELQAAVKAAHAAQDAAEAAAYAVRGAVAAGMWEGAVAKELAIVKGMEKNAEELGEMARKLISEWEKRNPKPPRGGGRRRQTRRKRKGTRRH